MGMNPHDVTRDFENALCEYTGAPYAVAVNSCTSALMLAVAWHLRDVTPWLEEAKKKIAENLPILPGGFPDFSLKYKVDIPKRTYVSVPQSIIHAGGRPTFRDEEWSGAYQLKPLRVWDSARWFTCGMFNQTGDIERIRRYGAVPPGSMICVSFHWTKTLGTDFRQGGAILHDSLEADAWLRRARFDGRTEGVAPKDDTFDTLGWHCYMDPTTARALLDRLAEIPEHNEPLPNDDYPDLSLHKAFQ